MAENHKYLAQTNKRKGEPRRLRGMTTIVRTLGIGRCSLLGELVDETETRYFYRRRFGHALASFVDKRSPVVHIVPCKACPDYSSQAESDEIANS